MHLAFLYIHIEYRLMHTIDAILQYTVSIFLRDCYYFNRITGTIAETTLIRFGLTFDGIANPLLVDLGTDPFQVTTLNHLYQL